MLKKIGRIILVVFIIGLGFMPIILSTPALAVTGQPDSTPTITQIHVNTYLYESGDILIYGMYDLPYATIPTIAANQNFKFYLMDAGLTTTYGMAKFYIYHDGGYNHGVVSFYFPDGVLTWGTSYKIRIEEIAGQFTSPVNTDITLPISAYSVETTQEANQLELAANLYDIGQVLEVEYDKPLFTTSEGKQILTDEGQTYFQGAISGLPAMAPTIFLFQKLEIDTTTKQYTTEQFDSYANRFSGTWVGDSMDAGGSMLGMGGNTFMMFIFTLPLCVGAVIFTSLKFKKTEPGLIFASLVMILAVLMGWMPQALFATIFQLFVIYIGYLLFYARAGDALGSKLLSFTIFCYFGSALICVIMEGTYFGTDEQSILNGISFFRGYELPIIGTIPVFNTDFIQSFGRILTWDYSFYSGSYAILRWFWFPILSAGPVWGLVQFFINIIPSIISIFRPSIAV